MRKLLIVISVLLQIALLAFMAAQREYINKNGKIIYLRTTPVDPRDYCRGDYVRLRYEITEVEREKCRDGLKEIYQNEKGQRYRQRGRKVYAVLNLDSNGVANLDYLTDIKPKSKNTFIKGYIKYFDSDSINVRYGIEAYFTEQKLAAELERENSPNSKNLLEIEVALGENGTAVIKKHRLVQNSQKIEDANKVQ